MIDVGKCWLTNYDNRTEERDEKSKLTSAFPELVSEPVDTGLEHCREMFRVCRLGFSQYMVCKSLQNLDFLSSYREIKRHIFFNIKIWLSSGQLKNIACCEISSSLSSSIIYCILKRRNVPGSCEWWAGLADPPTYQTKGSFPPGETRKQPKYYWQIWPRIRLTSDSEIIRGNIKLPTLNFQLLSFNGISTHAKECFIYLHHTTSTKFCVRKTSNCKCKTQFVRPLCCTWFSSCCSRRLERILQFSSC